MAEERHLGHAAERLVVTKARVSQRIQIPVRHVTALTEGVGIAGLVEHEAPLDVNSYGLVGHQRGDPCEQFAARSASG